jgi:hypothetical protein
LCYNYLLTVAVGCRRAGIRRREGALPGRDSRKTTSATTGSWEQCEGEFGDDAAELCEERESALETRGFEPQRRRREVAPRWARRKHSRDVSNYQGPSPGTFPQRAAADTSACRCRLCRPSGMAAPPPANGCPRFGQVAGRVVTT